MCPTEPPVTDGSGAPVFEAGTGFASCASEAGALRSQVRGVRPPPPGTTALLILVLLLLIVGNQWATTACADSGWPADPSINVVVCDTTGNQDAAKLVSDGSGGVFVGWNDPRSGPSTFRVKRLAANGEAPPGWLSSGSILGDSTIGGARQFLVRSGPDAAVACWQRSLTGEVLGQRVDTSGTLLWGPSGVPVSRRGRATAMQAVVALSDGGVMCFFKLAYANGSDTLFASRLDETGRLLWGEDVVVCDAVGSQNQLVAAAVSDSEVVAAWMDGRSTPIPSDPQAHELYAQKLRLDGSEAWAHNGVRVLSEAFEKQIAPNGRGGFAGICKYEDGGARLKLIDIDGSGTPLGGWPGDGLPLAPGIEQYGSLSVSPGDGQLLVVWWDYAGGKKLKAQRIDSAANVLLPNGGIAVFDTTAALSGWSSTPDERGGAFVAVELNGNILAQHVRVDASLDWPFAGMPVTTAPGSQMFTVLESDGSGGLFACWEDYRNSNTDSDLYAQHMNVDGSLGGAVTATDVAATEALYVDGCAQVTWYASDASGVPFTVERQQDGSGWVPLGTVLADGTGRVFRRDCEVVPRASYEYRLEWSNSGVLQHTLPILVRIGVPLALTLAPPAPNPSADSATFQYTLAVSGPVRISVYDLAGRRVAHPLEATQTAGTHRMTWNVRDDRGRPLTAGCYMLRLETEDGTRVRRLVVMP